MNLNRNPRVEKVAGRDCFDQIFFVMQFTKEKIEKLRTFKPPMSVEFGIVRRGDERRMTFKSFPQFIRLADAFADKIGGIFGGFLPRPIGNVSLFVAGRNIAPGNSVIL